MNTAIEQIETIELKRKARKVLKDAKIPLSFLGFRYLEYMLVESYNKGFGYKSYQEVAIRFKTTSSRVERAIRYICDSYQKQLKEYFNVDTKITAKRLFYLLAYDFFDNIESCS